jgi:hypothetical protein
LKKIEANCAYFLSNFGSLLAGISPRRVRGIGELTGSATGGSTAGRARRRPSGDFAWIFLQMVAAHFFLLPRPEVSAAGHSSKS